MNLDLLQAFQTVVNSHGQRDDNARVQMHRRDDIGSCFPRVEHASAPSGDRNREVRAAFKAALTSAFGVRRLDELPDEVKAVLKIRDFKLAKDGEVGSCRPLTIRRVRAVMEAVGNVAKSTLRDGGERSQLDRAFMSGFSEDSREVMEQAMLRLAVVSGRKPMEFDLGNGVNVSVPLSSLTAYTRAIAAERLAAGIDDLHDRIQRDVKEGCAIYECLKAGMRCEHSPEAARKLRHYLSFMALASGKGGGSRVVSVPDANGMVADFLKMDGSADARRLWANESISGAAQRVFFVSDLACLGAGLAPKRLPDVERLYRKLADNPRSSRVLGRMAEQGGLTVAQMQANAKAELERLSTVGDDELIVDARAELGSPKLSLEMDSALIGGTKTFRDFYAYRCALSEFLLYLQIDRADLDHPEMRIGDEIVLTAEDLKSIAAEESANRVLSPRKNVSPRRAEQGDRVEMKSELPNEISAGWCRNLLAACDANRSFRENFNIVARCIRFGLHPEGKEPPQEYDSIRNTDEALGALVEYLKGLDREWLADFAWYVKSGALLADNEAVNFGIAGPRREGERPLWSALARGLVNRKFPEHICRGMADLFKTDDLSQPFHTRLARRPLMHGAAVPDGADIAARAAVSVWGFGTYDMERILKYVKDCGCRIREMTADDLGKLAAIAALCDYKLEDAPMFVQRQTGKSISEITAKDIESLFRLKCSRRLNDKGAALPGSDAETVAVLKGDKLPSMTGATGKDVMRLLSALRILADAKPDCAAVVEFRGRKVSLRLTLSGTLVFNVGGFEYRAAKGAREFLEVVEDDVLGHVDKFGLHAVFSVLPQMRGAALPSDPAGRSRSRELCLRYLKRSAGIDPSNLASVGTGEIFRIAQAVADDRYSLRTGDISQSSVRAMLERTIDRDAMTSRDAIELYEEIKIRSGRVPGVDVEPMALRPPENGMADDVKAVHEFFADIIFDADPFEFEMSRRGDGGSRMIAVMRNHVPALVKIVRNPSLIATFPQDVAGEIVEVMGVFCGLLPTRFARNVSDAELAETFVFVLDNVKKGGMERRAAVDEFVRLHPAPKPAPAPAPVQYQSLFGFVGGLVSGVFSRSSARSPVRPPEAKEKANPLDEAKKEVLLAVFDRMSGFAADAEERIAPAVAAAMERVQTLFCERMAGQFASGDTSGNPVWSADFEEIVGEAMTDSGSGYGKFMYEVISTYFRASSPFDQRRMLASFVRHVDDKSTMGAMAGALFKGAGPLLQKMLQGFPPAALGEDMASALEDMKSNLLPIPDSYVKAGMNRIIERSGGRIKSVTVVRSLGAASVGQAFLCRMATENHPEGEECVVKLLRPTVKTAIVREREIFEAAAARVPGMPKTFEGQLSRILDELDFTLEATNVNFGRGVYEQPVYLRQRSLISGSEVQTLNFNSLHSMEVHPLVTPTMDCLVLKKAPGETYDRYMKDMERHFGEMMEGKVLENGRYKMPNLAELVHFRGELVRMYNETLKRQRFLIDLTKKWAHEGLFGGGFYHGDLHAGNIMTDGNGLTVIDFGNATHLTPVERGHVLRMISAALVGWNDMFESSFKALLSAEGRAAYEAKNADGSLSRDIAEVLKKGHGQDVGMRIAATLMLLQKHGIEVPGPIYNFNQCQMRLGGTVDAMNSLLNRIYSVLTRLQMPRIVYNSDGRDCASAQLADAAARMLNAILRFAERPFAGKTAAENAYHALEDVLGEFNPMSKDSDENYRKFVEELKDEAHCVTCLYPLIAYLQNMRAISNDGVPLKLAGAGIELKKTFDAYLAKDRPTDEDRRKLAVQIYRVFSELYTTACGLLEQQIGWLPESFLMAVGESISDSLYTVRTTLGNITSVKLKNAQKAEKEQIKRERERMRGSDSRVKAYRNAHPGSALDDYGVSVIKDVTSRMFFPFDLPGLDGGRKWLQDASARRRVFEAISVNVKRLLSELDAKFVFMDHATIATWREAACIAMQYLGDRFGGLFDAYSNVGNVARQRIMVEFREYLNEEGNAAAPGANTPEAECAMASLLYLFEGGSRLETNAAGN